MSLYKPWAMKALNKFRTKVSHSLSIKAYILNVCIMNWDKVHSYTKKEVRIRTVRVSSYLA